MRNHRPDEAWIAQDYLERYHHRASVLIEDNISRAIGSRRWDEVRRWHDIKARVLCALEAEPRRLN